MSPTPPTPPAPPAAPSQPPTRPPRPPGALPLQALGALLFLFIPLVLWLFVRHPQPIAASLAAGIVLMGGHRLLARPYMRRVLSWKCVWCNGVAAPGGGTLRLAASGEELGARCCAGHCEPAERFFRFLAAARGPLRAGIFLPLLLLLAALAAAAAGHPRHLAAATALFQLLVGLTVSAAAWGCLASGRRPKAGTEAEAAIPVPFPAHNFFLLGLRMLLWIFRLVGAWWIVRGAAYLLSLA
jgi:hypothetical protein